MIHSRKTSVRKLTCCRSTFSHPNYFVSDSLLGKGELIVPVGRVEHPTGAHLLVLSSSGAKWVLEKVFDESTEI